MTVAIIGAGITGLTLALELKKKGLGIRVYESSPEVGGVMKTLQKDGWLAEGGPNSIFETSTRIKNLIDDCNLRDQVLYTSPKAEKRYVVKNGAPAAVPGSPIQFIKSNLLSNKSKLLILKEPFVKPKPDDEEESLADFVRRRLGEEVLDYFVYPFVGGIYSGDPEKLSVKYAFKRFYTLEKKYGSIILGQFKAAKERKEHEIPRNKAKSFSFKAGLQTLPKAIHQRLGGDVKTNTQVIAINHNNNSYQVDTECDGEITRHTYDAVVYCGAAHSLDKIDIKSSGPTDVSELTKIPYPSVSSIALGFRKDQIDHPLDGFGILLPKKEDYKILGTQFNSTVFPGRTPDKDHVLLTTFVGGARFQEATTMDDKELLNIIMNDLDGLLGVKGSPVFVKHTRWPKAIPQYEIGYGTFLSIMDSVEKENPGLYLAGNYRSGIAVGDCISNSVELAERITNDISHIKKINK
ncbi:MAG: protoporphyrinogen oxidase [Balneolales bacterium]